MGCRIYRYVPVLASILLILFLALSSQWLFYSLEPGPLSLRQSVVFNLVVASQVICYARSCLTNPGVIRKFIRHVGNGASNQPARSRWCTKCVNIKPPRSHHCRECSKCVPKMDHHCVWIANCVSFRVFPHFFRFLFYSVAASAYLESHIFARLGILWAKRHFPSYLGPTVWQLVHFVVVTLVNSACLFAISMLFIRSVWALLWNITTIESWEIERHETLLRRARASRGRLYGPSGTSVTIEKHEFPYDIGIWRNCVQAMGTTNVRNAVVSLVDHQLKSSFKICSWVFPFSSSFPVDGGTSFETNGFDDATKVWPPPDPDRIFHLHQRNGRWRALAQDIPDFSNQSEKDEFYRRQSLDLSRKRKLSKNPMFKDLPNDPASLLRSDLVATKRSYESTPAGPLAKNVDKGWENAEGERLWDFGVDEETEFADEI